MEGDIKQGTLEGFGSKEHKHRATDALMAAKEVCCHPSMYLKHYAEGMFAATLLTEPFRHLTTPPPRRSTTLTTPPPHHLTTPPTHHPTISPRSSPYVVPLMSNMRVGCARWGLGANLSLFIGCGLATCVWGIDIFTRKGERALLRYRLPRARPRVLHKIPPTLRRRVATARST